MATIYDDIAEKTKEFFELMTNPSYANDKKFQNIEIKLPYRYSVYETPELIDSLFITLFETLESGKKRFNKQDAWRYDLVMTALTGTPVKATSKQILNRLIKNYKIPEGHIYIKMEPVPGQLFESENVYISRLGMYMVAKELLSKSKSWENDLGNSDPDPDVSKNEFEYEMKIAFMRYYAAIPKVDQADITNLVWDWVRGDLLKSKFTSAKGKVDSIVKSHRGKYADWRTTKDFREKHILNILFKTLRTESGFKFPVPFQNKFISALSKARYIKIGEDWFKNGKKAPDEPYGFIAPNVAFILIKYINQFCDDVYDQEKQVRIKQWLYDTFGRGNKNSNTISTPESLKQNNGIAPDKLKFQDLELMAMTFFMQIRIGMEKAIPGFATKPLFYPESNSVSYARIKEIEFGKAEDPGVLEFLSEKQLINEDEQWCISERKNLEQKLFDLQDEFNSNYSEKLAQEILDCRQRIEQENINVYGCHIEEFVNVPKVIRPEKPKKEKQKNRLFPDFQILPTTIPSGPTCKRGKNGGMYLNKNGELEKINPFASEPQIYDIKSRTPSMHDVNYESYNFVFECDNMDLDKQLDQARRLISIGLVNRVVYSGGKSYHLRVTVKDAPKNPDEYKWLYYHIAEKYKIEGFDRACCHNGRATRKPNAMREKEVDGKTVQIKQDLIHQSNTVCNLDWRSVYEAEKAAGKIKVKSSNRRGGYNIGTALSKIDMDFSFKPIFSEKYVIELREEVNTLLMEYAPGNRNTLIVQSALVRKMMDLGHTPKQIISQLTNDQDTDIQQLVVDQINEKLNEIKQRKK